MQFSLFVNSAPVPASAGLCPYLFAQALLNSEHSLYRVFFFSAGVLYAGNESSLSHHAQQWAQLNQQRPFDLCVCPASVERYLSKECSDDLSTGRRINANMYPIHPAFELGGLMQLVDASQQSDRIVSF